MASPVTGSASAVGLSSTFIPVAGQPFSVSIGNNAAASAGGVSCQAYLVRSLDAGATYAPVNPQVSSQNPNVLALQAPVTFDVVESRAGVIYAIEFASVPTNGNPVAYGFYQ